MEDMIEDEWRPISWLDGEGQVGLGVMEWRPQVAFV